MKSSEQSTNSKEEKELYDLVARLLRMKEACEGWYGKREKLLAHLKSKHKIEIASVDQLGKIMRQDEGSGFYKPEYKSKWKDFVTVERDKIISTMYIKGQFSGIENTFNFQSAFDLINAAEEADKCVFWNTYIDMDEWHSPLIQMHLCIQKSIEQKNNFASIHGCHNLADNSTERKGAISFCTKNPPVYRHYRILFLPLTDKEFTDRLNKKDSFYENLRFSTLMHCSLSIQLAVVTTTQLVSIMVKEKTGFFKDETNLKTLGLNTTLASMLSENKSTNDMETLLKENLEVLEDVPDKATEIGMDFLHIHRKTEKKGKKNFWTAYDDKNDGLTYYPFSDTENIKVKKKFSDIMFECITHKDDKKPAQLELMNLDPIYPFYKKNTDREFVNIFPKYDPKTKVNLYA